MKTTSPAHAIRRALTASGMHPKSVKYLSIERSSDARRAGWWVTLNDAETTIGRQEVKAIVRVCADDAKAYPCIVWEGKP